jgi:hypothetical protein
MRRLKLHDWCEGFKKVSFTRIQVQMLGLSLSEAKNNTDKLLNGEEVTFEIEDEILLYEFLKSAIDLGVVSGNVSN